MTLRWIGRSFVLLLAVVAGAAAVVLIPADLAGWSVPAPDRIGDAYLYALFVLPFSWPLYLAVLAVVARRVRRPRRWAIALAPPLLGLWMVFLLIFIVDQPSFLAAWLLWLSYGALVPLPPGGAAQAQGP